MTAAGVVLARALLIKAVKWCGANEEGPWQAARQREFADLDPQAINRAVKKKNEDDIGHRGNCLVLADRA
jgi:hypothetical protein